MPRDYLSNIDAAMLHLEDETNSMTITGILTLGHRIELEGLRTVVEAKLAGLSRFRQRAVWRTMALRPPYWESDPDLDLGYHIQRAVLPPPGDQQAFWDTVSLLASTPLDLTRSPWQFHLVNTEQDRCAVIMRMHHCVGDGLAMMHLLYSLADLSPDAGSPVQPPPVPRREPARWRDALASGRQRFRPALGQAVQGDGSQKLLELGREGAGGALDLGRFLLLEPDPETVFKGPLGRAKRVAWAKGISLEEIRTIRERLGGTVNDVVVTVITGALRRYLEAHGEPVDEIALRAAVPVNLRPLDQTGKLGNRMGAVFLTLPVWNADPACRLRQVELYMKDRKASHEPPLFYVLLNVLGMAPARLAKRLVSIYGMRATAVVTNVKGPQEQLYLAGAPVDGCIAWVPQTGSIGLGISIFSYMGQLSVGVMADAGLVPDPEAIVTGFHAEFEELLAQARD